MEELVILEYSTNTVHFYKVAFDKEITEDTIRELGHNPNECSWMIAENIDIFKHKGVLL